MDSQLWRSTLAAAFLTTCARPPTAWKVPRESDALAMSALWSVHKHLRVLREAGVVTVRVDGPRRVYSLAPRPLSDVTAWLEPYRQMWSDSLDALERHLDSGPEQPEQNQEDAP